MKALALQFLRQFQKTNPTNFRFAMAYLRSFMLLSLFLLSVLFFSPTVKCDDEEDDLLAGINRYRASLRLPALRKNERADCFAEEVADQFDNQPCTNTTGSNTVPGTEPQLSKYPQLLEKCRLNVTATRDGAILPACVPHLVSSLVLSNFTQSQYSKYLNDSKYTGVGIGKEDDWIVVVLTTSTPTGGFATAINNNYPSAGVVLKFNLIYCALVLLIGISILL